MMTLAQLLDRFRDEDACYEYLTKLRWAGEVRCPKCGSDKVYRLKSARWKWICKAPSADHTKGYRFSPLVGSIFENTNIPLRTWFQTILLMCQSKKGMSALQIQRTLGLGSYKSAWYMCHRIRAAMENTDFSKLMGEVEVDETYVGGQAKNKHMRERIKLQGQTTKVPVIGAISRKGKIVAQVIETASAQTLQGFVDRVVSRSVKLVATDQQAGYHKLSRGGFAHQSVNHSTGEYVRGLVHTQTIESFWSLLKRGIMGQYHHVSRRYLPFYLAEFTFRHNERDNPDMFSAVVRAC
jgi:hypothetical protein